MGLSSHQGAILKLGNAVDNTGLQLNGTSQYVSFGMPANWSLGTNDFSIKARVLRSSGSTGQVFGNGSSGGTNASIQFSLGFYGGNMRAFAYIGGFFHVLDGPFVDTIEPHDIELRRTGNTLALYLDGVEHVPTTVSGAGALTNDVVIGRLGEFNGFYFHGVVLNASIAIAGADEGVYPMPLNEDPIQDTSGNGPNGTLVNNPAWVTI